MNSLEQAQDLKAFERRFTEYIHCLQPAMGCWRMLLIVVSVCTATGAWNWLIDSETQKTLASVRDLALVQCQGSYMPQERLRGSDSGLTFVTTANLLCPTSSNMDTGVGKARPHPDDPAARVLKSELREVALSSIESEHGQPSHGMRPDWT
ncbi:hypothetical protein A6R68_11155 [Neotoma lepida]|uniref:Nuclear envelope phosphatase-regulatory subunit 1 n=1 Tax=Neotoma lepida TaxID=56216 RepID=A0A1A6FUU2_NEOLE|nr:hypothetical protein A6R68_11155 [Neotoma lepida]